MREYQYYEFHAIDRPLSKDQMAELRHILSRAQITAAAEKSGDESTPAPASQEIVQWVVALSLEEKEAILVRLIEG
jgi:hypothetical protein